LAEKPGIREEALDTLGSWLQGYTDPDDEGKQWRLRLQNDTDEGLVFTAVEQDYYGQPPVLRYRVDVTVTELPPETQTSEIPAVEAETEDNAWFWRE
jgi:hypothetical protein